MTIKSYNTNITFSDTITVDGAAYDLTGSTAKFVMRNQVGGVAFSDDAVVDPDQTANKGKVTYQPGTNFPVVPGIYWQEWTVTKDAKTFTFPADSYEYVRIIENLSGAPA